MAVLNYSGLSPAQMMEVELQIGAHRTLADVLQWGFSLPPEERSAPVIADFVVQDEFSHDVLVPWRDGLWLAYQAS